MLVHPFHLLVVVLLLYFARSISFLKATEDSVNVFSCRLIRDAKPQLNERELSWAQVRSID